MGVSALTGLSVVSLLSLGYLSWDWTQANQVENDVVSAGELGDPDIGPPLHRPPHIIFIMTDDQGFNDIGYHSKDIRTPVLDKLAAQGVKLENYYIQPTCTPSRSQFMTGRYQIHTGLQHGIIRPQQPNCLPLDQPTLPEQLQQLGYSTHMVGKWHLGFYKRACLPTRRGFDSYFGSLTGSVDYYSYWACDGPGVCGFDLREGERVAWSRAGTYSTQLYTRRVRKILAAHDPNAAPLFIFLSFQAVHTPLQSPRSYIYPYRRLGNVERRKYAAMVTAVDEAVRNVTAALRKYGYYDNSVMVFSTDNGGQPLFGGSNWPLRGRKGTYWEGGVRGLGFVHSPLLRRPRRVSRDLLHITDWYPTLLRIAGGNLSALAPEVDGHDAWRSISEGTESPRHEILHNIDPLHSPSPHGSLEEGWGLWDTSVQAAVRVGDWKLLTGDPGYGDWTPPQMLASFPGAWWNLERHTAPRRSLWLYNVTADPYERQDMSQQRPDVVRLLLARLAYYNRTAVPVRYPPEDPRAQPQNNGGAWGPWASDDESQEEQDWGELSATAKQLKLSSGKEKSKGKCKHCSMRAFFKKLNTGIMSNRI